MSREDTLKIVDTGIKSLQIVKDSLDERIDTCVDLMSSTRGNVLVAGMGTSGTVARRTAHLLGCAGLKAFFAHPADQQHGASGLLTEDDLIIVFSKGGESEEVNTFLGIARDQGCTIIAITGREKSTMAEMVDEKIVVEIPEEYEGYGLLPTASTLAVSMVSDILLLLLLKKKGFDKEGFGLLHPGGMTGKKLGVR